MKGEVLVRMSLATLVGDTGRTGGDDAGEGMREDLNSRFRVEAVECEHLGVEISNGTNGRLPWVSERFRPFP